MCLLSELKRNFPDPSTCSNFHEVVVKHLHLQWNVDFEKNIIEGKATLDVEALKDVSEILLDARDLKISAVHYQSQQVKFQITENGALGQKIIINLGTPLKAGEKIKIEVTYQTGKDASALQFMEKELTADKTHPYLYSQCQAIHARSIAPCMDTPAIKHSYSAEVTVPKGMTCLMSALNEGSEAAGEKTKFKFSQPMPIPSYLLAIVVGALEKRSISDRCCVWSEPSVVDKAAWEFADTEKMLQTAEELMGEYEWKRYDMVVLPPSFPFGGMENPCLTFVTPTLLAGDRSLTFVVAHEIAHSYTGNLVTNASWEHFWLNEGFTVFVERKIMGRLYGEEVREFENIAGWEDRLLTTIHDTFSPVHEYTKLIPDLKGNDPDDAFSTIPYEKGSALLLYLEQQLGGPQKFEEMLREYIKTYRQRSIDTDVFLQFLRSYYPEASKTLNAVDFDGWLNKPGVPPNKPKFDESLVTVCRKLAEEWSSGVAEKNLASNVAEYQKLNSVQKVKVLDCIETGPVLSHEQLSLLQTAYSLNPKDSNADLMFSFLLVGIKARWSGIIQPALEFVQSNGRVKYVRPIYKKLFGWEEVRGDAVKVFEKNIPVMHPITVIVVKGLLQ